MARLRRRYYRESDRKCAICGCELYEDETGIYCQDCRGVLALIARLHDAPGYYRVYAADPSRERRIRRHCRRVVAEESQLLYARSDGSSSKDAASTAKEVEMARNWRELRTDESRLVEEVIRAAGFASVDAYRHNAASLRVRVVDPRFTGRSTYDRLGLLEPSLETLPGPTQTEIVNLFLFSPDELAVNGQLNTVRRNVEFENPDEADV